MATFFFEPAGKVVNHDTDGLVDRIKQSLKIKSTTTQREMSNEEKEAKRGKQ